MQSYPQRVSENILPLSIASTLPEAFEEWTFTDNTVDHEEPIETCQLCNQEELRYHFEIKNSLTKKCLWVGSQCILKFNLSVFEEGQRLTPTDSKKKLNRLMKQMRLESCVKALSKLAETENHTILKNALSYYHKNKYLTHKFAFVVFWKLQSYDIDHTPTFFKISLRKQKYKNDLSEMTTDRVHKIWAALSSTQKKLATKMGHTPP